MKIYVFDDDCPLSCSLPYQATLIIENVAPGKTAHVIKNLCGDTTKPLELEQVGQVVVEHAVRRQVPAPPKPAS